MVHLFADFYEKQYKVSCCSCIAFVWAFFLSLAIIGPFLEAYYSGGKNSNSTLYSQLLEFRFMDQAADLLWTCGCPVQWRTGDRSDGCRRAVWHLLDRAWDKRPPRLMARRCPFHHDVAIDQPSGWQVDSIALEHRYSWRQAEQREKPASLRLLRLLSQREASNWNVRYDAHQSRHT